MLTSSELESARRKCEEMRKLFDEGLILSIDQAAEYFGVGRSKLYRLCRDKAVGVQFGVEYFVSVKRAAVALNVENYSDFASEDRRRQSR